MGFNVARLLSLGIIEYTVVRQGELRVIEQRGRFKRVAEPGICILLSLWGYGETIGTFPISHIRPGSDGRVHVVPRQAVEVIPTRTQVDDYPKESVITRDNATVHIDAVVYYRVFDAAKAVYEVQDYVAALQKLVQSALRDECGKYELDQLLVSRERINAALRQQLDTATDPWGIKVERVEIKDIDLGSFAKILAEQRAAETKRRTEITQAEGAKTAAVLEAEGINEAQILKAKGDKVSTILRAEADKQSRILRAEGEAEAMLRMRQAEAQTYGLMKEVLDGSASSKQLLAWAGLNTTKSVAEELASGTATKVFLSSDPSAMFGLHSAELVGNVRPASTEAESA